MPTKKVSKKNVSDVSKVSKASKTGKSKKPIETFEMSETSVERFHDRDGAPYATYKSGSRIRTCAVNSSDYRNFIRHSAWKQGETRNKTPYTPCKDQINAAAIALGVHEELRPEGEFWSLPIR